MPTNPPDLAALVALVVEGKRLRQAYIDAPPGEYTEPIDAWYDWLHRHGHWLLQYTAQLAEVQAAVASWKAEEQAWKEDEARMQERIDDLLEKRDAERDISALLEERVRVLEGALEAISGGCPGTSTEWHDGTKPCPACAPWSYARAALNGAKP